MWFWEQLLIFLDLSISMIRFHNGIWMIETILYKSSISEFSLDQTHILNWIVKICYLGIFAFEPFFMYYLRQIRCLICIDTGLAIILFLSGFFTTRGSFEARRGHARILFFTTFGFMKKRGEGGIYVKRHGDMVQSGLWFRTESVKDAMGDPDDCNVGNNCCSLVFWYFGIWNAQKRFHLEEKCSSVSDQVRSSKCSFENSNCSY